MRATTLERLSLIAYINRNDPAAGQDMLEKFISAKLNEGDMGIQFHAGIKKQVRRIMDKGK